MIRERLALFHAWLGDRLGIITSVPYVRPRKMASTTERRRTSCGKVYITVSRDENGKPREAFFQGGSDGCAGNQSALGRTVSIALRYHVPAERIAAQLRECHCGASMKKMGKIEKDETLDRATRKEYCRSCADAMARAIMGEK